MSRYLNGVWLELHSAAALTDGHRSFSSQQQFETLAVVRQAAVMQRRASSGRLLVQVSAETQTVVTTHSSRRTPPGQVTKSSRYLF